MVICLQIAMATEVAPFVCTGEAFTVRLSPGQLFEIDQSVTPFDFIPIGGTAQLNIPVGLDAYNPTGGLTDIELNNIGFRSTNGMIYAMALKLFVTGTSAQMGNYGLVKIDSNGNVFPVALPLPGVPAIGNNVYRFPAGDVSTDGTKYFINTQITNNGVPGVSNTLFVVDLNAIEADPTDVTAVTTVTKSGFGTSVNVADWAYNPFDGMLYGAAPTPNPARIWKLDPVTGVMTIVPGSGALGLPTGTTATAAYGGVWFNGEGHLVLYRNVGTIYTVSLNGGPGIGGCVSDCPHIVDTQSLGPSSNYNDATACVSGDIKLDKTVADGSFNPDKLPGSESVTITSGTSVTYFFTVTNTGGTYLADIDVVDTDLGISISDLTLYSGEIPLVPGARLLYYYETTLSSYLLNTATVTGNPVTSGGVDIPLASDVSDSDTAEVQISTIAAVEGVVYEDTNGNGVQDEGEPGIEGVTVYVDGIISLTTNSLGYYWTPIPSGSVTIDVDEDTLPPGMIQTGGTDPTTITVLPGETGSDQDGFQLTPSPTPSPTSGPTECVGSLLDNYVLFALNSLGFKGNNGADGDRGKVLGGNVGVNAIDTTPDNSEALLAVGTNGAFEMSDNTYLIADSIRLGDLANVYDVYRNIEIGTGWNLPTTIRNNVYTFTPPIFSSTELSVETLCGPFAPLGTADHIVSTGTVSTLAPGSYLDVRVRDGGTLYLTPGTYTFRRFNTGSNVNVYTQPGVVIHIWGSGNRDTDFNLDGYFGSEDTAIESVSCICISDTVINQDVQFSVGGTFWGVIYAPSAQVSLGRAFNHYGRFIAGGINSDWNVNVEARNCKSCADTCCAVIICYSTT